MKPTRARPEKYRRGFALILVLIVGILLIGLSVFVFGLSKFSPKSIITNVLTKPSPSLAIKTYPTQEECESATGKSCSILMCDVVPEGKTFEETCGIGFKTGWAPTKLNDSPQSDQNSDKTANWKTYSNTNQGFLIKYPDRYLITEEDKRVDPLDWRIIFTSTNTELKPSNNGPVGNISIVTIKSSQDIDSAAQSIGISVKNKTEKQIYGNTYLLFSGRDSIGREYPAYAIFHKDRWYAFSYYSESVDKLPIVENDVNQILSTLKFSE